MFFIHHRNDVVIDGFAVVIIEVFTFSYFVLEIRSDLRAVFDLVCLKLGTFHSEAATTGIL